MSGVVRIRSIDAAVTYPVKTGTAHTIRGGQLVEAAVGGAGVAGVDSLAVLGVAQKDAFNAAANTAATGVSTSGAGQPFIDVSGPNPSLVVAEKGYFKVTYASDAVFGDLLKAAANGAVTKAVAADLAAGKVVGSCVVVGGVTNGAVAEARITGNV